MTPAVGSSAARISLEVVVLPQPDSPTRPKVSLIRMVKLTPSTALTHPCLRPHNEPPTAKCFLRSRTSNNGSGTFRLLHREPAPDAAAVVSVVLCGLLGTAVIDGIRATGVEATAQRQ